MSFEQKKRHILSQISVTDEENPDASPKGTIDKAIVPLMDQINQHDDFVTTSSCSGRVSVFLEGTKDPTKLGGKGLGGKWLYVTHSKEELSQSNGEWWNEVKTYRDPTPTDDIRYILYKFEPMVSLIDDFPPDSWFSGIVFNLPRSKPMFELPELDLHWLTDE